MVTRKSSLPYPASPSAHNPKPDPYFPSSDSLMVDSADLPPIPKTQRGANGARKETMFLEEDNPWGDQSSPGLRSDRPVPDFLKPRHGKPVQGEKQHSMQDIPQALRAGKSGQDTPRSSMDSDRSRDFWDDDDVGEEDAGRKSPDKAVPKQALLNSSSASQDLPSQIGVKRKPVAPAAALQPDLTGLASNNPFRRSPSSENGHPQQHQVQVPQDLPNWGDELALGKGKEVDRRAWDQDPLTDQPPKTNIQNSMIPDLSPYSGAHADSGATEQWQQSTPDRFAPPQPVAAPPPIPQQLSPFSQQPPLIPVTPQQDQTPNPWASQPQSAPTPSPIPFHASQRHVSEYNNSMLGRSQHTGNLSLGDELTNLPNVAGNSQKVDSRSSLLGSEDVGPVMPIRPKIKAEDDELYAPPEGPPPTRSRPSLTTSMPSDAEIAKSIEQRNETYQIKHFNWFDHGSGRLRRSSMLTQNKNGPCPLLALVNALILGAKDETQAALDDALRSREQVSLGLIIETLMDELLSRGYQSGSGALPDVDELNGFLMRLRTGMNANPRFVSPVAPVPNLMDARNSVLHLPQLQRAQQEAGTFEATPDLKLYGAFSVPLLHGWLPEPGSDAAEAFARSAQTYEDAQALQFGEEELEYKLSRDGLSPEEQRIWEDINSIKNFLKQYPTQLTPQGLELVRDVLSSGSFAIMFRNDHFSTIYKHPQSGQLFTLITDAGYADRDEIIWESLVDITGKNSEFYSGDFMPVSHQQAQPSTSTDPSARGRSSSQNLSVDPTSQAALSPQEQQEQHDADFAMALQLQEEEEQSRRAQQARRRSNTNPANPNSASRSSQGNIPIQLRSTAQRQNDSLNSRSSDDVSNRPLIPPRTSRSQIPAVSRPSDALDDDAPPAYEEAAKGRPYIPPVGSPLHPASEPSGSASGINPMNSSNQLVGTVSNASNQGNSSSNFHPPGPSSGRGGRQPGMPGRRTSAYNEQHFQGYYGNPLLSPNDPRRQMPGGYGARMGRGSGQGIGQGAERERDCVVM